MARVVKERKGLSAWGLGEKEASGNGFGFGSCREDDGIVAIFVYWFFAFFG